VSSSLATGSAVSEVGTLGFIREYVPLSEPPTCSLATLEDERDWIRTQGRDLVSSGYHCCRETHSASTLPCPMPIRAMSIPTKRTRYPPLQSFHPFPPLRSLHIHGRDDVIIDALAYFHNHLAPFPRPLLRCLTRLTSAIHWRSSCPAAQLDPNTKRNLIPSPFLSLMYIILHPPLSLSVHDALRPTFCPARQTILFHFLASFLSPFCHHRLP
jgi:hypothetical protein